MAGIFPRPGDGTLPPNPNDPGNPSRAYQPVNSPLDTAVLLYGNGCDVRLRPEVMNSIISELAALTDSAELNYNPARQTNIELATRYLIQRGLPKYIEANIVAEKDLPNVYTATLDPPPTRYNDGMVLCLLPSHQNIGPVRLDINSPQNNLGERPVLRNDGKELELRDWTARVPVLIAYYDCNWYMIGLVRSQCALVHYGCIDVWVRTDGSDETGDGEFNTAESAFRTIQRAFYEIAGRYATTPSFCVNIRLGIPGEYEGADFARFASELNLWGDVNNPDGYIITPRFFGPHIAMGLNFNAILWGTVNGVTCRLSMPYPPRAGYGVNSQNGSTVIINHCNFDLRASNSIGCFINARARATLFTAGRIRVFGNNFDIGSVIGCAETSQYMNAEGNVASTFDVSNIYVGNGIWCYGNSMCDLAGHTFNNTNTSGPRYGVAAQSMIMAWGAEPPGSEDGVTSNEGYFVP